MMLSVAMSQKTIILYRWLYIHSSKEEFSLSGGLKHYKSDKLTIVIMVHNNLQHVLHIIM